MVPSGTWKSPLTDIIWSVQWKMKGLMPIRPQVIFIEAGKLPAGRGLEFKTMVWRGGVA
jgi:hypothetical protein